MQHKMVKFQRIFNLDFWFVLSFIPLLITFIFSVVFEWLGFFIEVLHEFVFFLWTFKKFKEGLRYAISLSRWIKSAN